MILTQEALFEERIGRLAEEIISAKDRKFIMIAGPSSSGKTTFSHRLSIQLAAKGLNPHPFPLDDYYRTGISVQGMRTANWILNVWMRWMWNYSTMI